MPAAAPDLDERRSSPRATVLHSWLTFFRPSILALLAALIFVGVAPELAPETQFILLRIIELLVLVMYLWQFARHGPSFLEASGILLTSLGFLFLVFKSAFIAATFIITLAVAWLVMTWIAKHWPLLRGLTTVALFAMVLRPMLVLLLVEKHGDSSSSLLDGFELILLCLLAFIAFASSQVWSQQPLFLGQALQHRARLWSTVLFIAVFSQNMMGAGVRHSHASTGDGLLFSLHQYGGVGIAILIVAIAWKARLWLGRLPGLRWIPPALMIMPVNQAILGFYIVRPEENAGITHFHALNGLGILILCFLITASIWSSTPSTGVPDQRPRC